MTKIRIKNEVGLASYSQVGKRGKHGLERKQEETRQTKRKKQEKNKSKAILRYFLAYFDLSSYFEGIIMNP